MLLADSPPGTLPRTFPRPSGALQFIHCLSSASDGLTVGEHVNLLPLQRGTILSPVPLARHILGWMFKAEEFGTKQLLRQLKAANLLSYAAVEDIITTGMASTCPLLFCLCQHLISLACDVEADTVKY